MSKGEYSIGSRLSRQCELIILEFEKRQEAPNLPQLREWYHSVDPDSRDELICELARIELERDLENNRSLEVSRYLAFFPDVFEKERLREAVAFEHFRLAFQFAIPVSLENLMSRYRIQSWDRFRVRVDEIVQSERWNTQVKRESEVDFPDPGESVAGYYLLALLGRGAAGHVYLAKQPDLAERYVVLKMTTRESSESDRLARLQHSNVVPIYSIHYDRGLYCICMPFLGLLTLADLMELPRIESNSHADNQAWITTMVNRRVSTIATSGAPSVVQSPSKRDWEGDVSAEGTTRSIAHSGVTETCKSEEGAPSDDAIGGSSIGQSELCELLGCQRLVSALKRRFEADRILSCVQILAEVAAGLGYTHHEGIIHSDIKPENILISNDGHPVLLDFNLAQPSQLMDNAPLGGTLPYMSPQHLRRFRDGQAPQPTDDVFSLGVLIYQWLTGAMPFRMNGLKLDLESMARQRESPIPSARMLNKEITPGLSAIIDACLNPSEALRYQNGKDLAEDLNCYLNNRPLRHIKEPSWTEVTHKFLKRHPALTSSASISIFATLLLCILGLVGYRYREQSRIQAAIANGESLRSRVAPVLAMLHNPEQDPYLLSVGISESQKLLQHWRLDEDGFHSNSPVFLLPPHKRLFVQFELLRLGWFTLNADRSRSIQSNEYSSNESQAEPTQRQIKWRKLMDQFHQDKSSSIASEIELDENRNRNYEVLERAKEQGDFETWLRLADSDIDLNPTDPYAWFNYASAKYSLGEYADAQHAFDVVCRLLPDSIQSHFWRGVCSMMLERNEAALKDFDWCIAKQSDWDSPKYNRIQILERKGLIVDASKEIELLLSSNPDSIRFLALKSKLLAQLGQIEGARSIRDVFLNMKPKYAEDFCIVGTYLIGSDPEKAEKLFESALSINPNHFVALQNSVHVLSESLGKNEMAIERLNRLEKTRPRDASVIATRGILNSRLGNVEAAITDAKIVEKMDPGALEQLQLAGIYSLAIKAHRSSTPGDENPEFNAESLRKVALDALRNALARSPDLVDLVQHDPDTQAIRNENEYKVIVQAAKSLVSSGVKN